MSVFNPQQFLDAQFTESNDTVLRPIPAGEYIGYIEPGTVDVKQWKSNKDPSVTGLKLASLLVIDDAAVRAELGRDKVTCRYEVMLDITEEGGLDMGKGKNITLGRLREATGCNEAGQPFAFRMLEGRPMKVLISHRVDDNDSSKVYTDVKGVAKL